MDKELNPMDKFHFLLGTWKMEYKIPKSRYNAEDIGVGEGAFRSILNNRYVTFDYHVKLSKSEVAAHAIFAWDEDSKIYRYWWFEDSGAFIKATCNFINEDTLCLNWHNSLMVQTFHRTENGNVILQMKNPSNNIDYEIILEVVFTDKNNVPQIQSKELAKSKNIVFIHGMYMTPLCWEKWIDYFQAKGYKCLAPAWPDRDVPIETLRRNHPDPQLGKFTLTRVLEHFTKTIGALDEKPIIIGHSMGGLFVQLLLQKELAVAGVAIDSAPPKGVHPANWSFLKSNWAHITPFVSQSSPVKMTFGRFQDTFVNSLPFEDQWDAYERYVVPESRRVPRESLTVAVDFKKPHPPLLMIAGSDDNLIPASLNKSNYAKYGQSSSITDFKEFEGRNHFILGQDGWEEVADYILSWLDNRGL